MSSSRMTALLALLAVAGYQNRDKLGELLGNITGQGRPGAAGNSPGAGGESGGFGGLRELLGGLFGSGNAAISGGLGDLITTISRNGHGEVANSWVQTGPNKDLSSDQLATALGEDTIDQLAKQTGLSRDELLTRLQSVLPTAVDKLTPQGRMPKEAESSQSNA